MDVNDDTAHNEDVFESDAGRPLTRIKTVGSTIAGDSFGTQLRDALNDLRLADTTDQASMYSTWVGADSNFRLPPTLLRRGDVVTQAKVTAYVDTTSAEETPAVARGTIVDVDDERLTVEVSMREPTAFHDVLPLYHERLGIYLAVPTTTAYEVFHYDADFLGTYDPVARCELTAPRLFVAGTTRLGLAFTRTLRVPIPGGTTSVVVEQNQTNQSKYKLLRRFDPAPRETLTLVWSDADAAFVWDGGPVVTHDDDEQVVTVRRVRVLFAEGTWTSRWWAGDNDDDSVASWERPLVDAAGTRGTRASRFESDDGDMFAGLQRTSTTAALGRGVRAQRPGRGRLS